MTKSRRYGRRVVAVSIVGIVATIAWAGSGGVVLVATPNVVVLESQVPLGKSGTLMLQNNGAAGVTISDFASSSCGGIIATPAGGFPVTIGPDGAALVNVICPPEPVGMARCLFHAEDAGKVNSVDFMVVCEEYMSNQLTAIPSTLAFPMTQVGAESAMPLLIRNDGILSITDLSLQIDDLAGNFEIGMPCNPDSIFCDPLGLLVGQGSAANLTVKCKPRQAGNLTAKLYAVASDGLTQTLQQPPAQAGYRLPAPVTLTCTGLATTDPIFNETPSTVDLPPVEVVNGLGSGVVHVSNTGGGMLSITDVRIDDASVPGAAMDWSYTASGKCNGAIPPACSLANSEQVDINLRFDPSQIGSRNASLQISYHDTADRSTSVPLDAIGQGATLAMTGPNPIDFGSVPVGVTSNPPVTLSLSNAGNRDLMVTTLSVSPAGPITVSPTNIPLITPVAPVTVNATCRPVTTGPINAMIHISSNDATTGSPIDIPVTCNGTDMALFSMPSTVNFGEIRTGTAPNHIMITLQSTSSPLTLNPPTLETTDPNLSLTALSSATTPATFELVVDPMSDDSVANKIVVTDTASETLKIPITGKVVTAMFTVPSMLSLGTFCISAPTTSSAVALQSTGTATIRLPNAPVLATPGSPFDLGLTSPLSYPASLAPGAAAIVEITPKRVASPSTVTDRITWSTDVMGQTSPQTGLAASFVANGGAIAPSALDFGQVPIHLVQDNAKRITLQNCNPTILHLNAPMIDAPFVISGPPPPDMLQPMETTTFSIGFEPTVAGVFNSQLVITSDDLPGMNLTVDLSGIGTSGTGDDDGGTGSLGHTSFYACSCNGPGAPARGWPIALAIAIACLRRRRR